MMNLKYPVQSQPKKKYSPRELLDELVRNGYRAYICGDPGYGVVIAWSHTLFKKEYDGLAIDWEGSLQRVAYFLDCGAAKLLRMDASLEHLINSSIKIEQDDDGGLVSKPLSIFLLDKSQKE